jgi:hypothetical protein
MLEDSVFDSENTTSEDNSSLEPQFTRRALFAMGAIAGIALSLPALPVRADVAYGDAISLRFLQEVAQLEADFFARAANSSTAEGFQERELSALALIAKEDAELVRWFKAASATANMGSAWKFYTPNTSTSRPVPVYHFNLNNFETRTGLYSAAIEIKETAVGAFHGIVGQAKEADMIEAFAALAGVQGRHLAMLQELAGQNPFVTTESALSKKTVADNLASYGFNREVMA